MGAAFSEIAAYAVATERESVGGVVQKILLSSRAGAGGGKMFRFIYVRTRRENASNCAFDRIWISKIYLKQSRFSNLRERIFTGVLNMKIA